MLSEVKTDACIEKDEKLGIEGNEKVEMYVFPIVFLVSAIW